MNNAGALKFRASSGRSGAAGFNAMRELLSARERCAERRNALVQLFFDEVTHPPRGFVGHADFALHLLCTDVAGLHQKNYLKPQRKRGRRFVKNGIRGGRDLLAATLARQFFATCYGVVFRDLSAFWALDALRPTLGREVQQTRFFVGKIAAKIGEGVWFFSGS